MHRSVAVRQRCCLRSTLLCLRSRRRQQKRPGARRTGRHGQAHSGPAILLSSPARDVRPGPSGPRRSLRPTRLRRHPAVFGSSSLRPACRAAKSLSRRRVGSSRRGGCRGHGCHDWGRWPTDHLLGWPGSHRPLLAGRGRRGRGGPEVKGRVEGEGRGRREGRAGERGSGRVPGGAGRFAGWGQAEASAVSSVKLRVLLGSTGIPGPIVVVKVTFLTYRPLAAAGLSLITSSRAAP